MTASLVLGESIKKVKRKEGSIRKDFRLGEIFLR